MQEDHTVPEPTVVVTRGAEAETFDLPGVRFRSLAAPRLGSGQVCFWRLTVDVGVESPEAHTLDRDEVFAVLEGRVRVVPGGAELEAGDVAVVPAGSPIRLRNTGDQQAALHVAIQAGFSATMDGSTAAATPPWAA
ncbi:cupin domain-containing protein [Cellulomonas sp. PhB143]|uniref:cupin domain-containing protein n=1 Tax=Cellulomonas sp. PhB143 TaxID=2485186 RepID=UPI000F47BDEE|nr:cupin domain-containing protein [Cellulomonas sp. PhB143]ROS72083.1 cupin domain [Cellulomonas sp. PhB143]